MPDQGSPDNGRPEEQESCQSIEGYGLRDGKRRRYEANFERAEWGCSTDADAEQTHHPAPHGTRRSEHSDGALHGTEPCLPTSPERQQDKS